MGKSDDDEEDVKKSFKVVQCAMCCKILLYVSLNELSRQRQIKQLYCTQDNFFPEKGKKSCSGWDSNP